MILPCTTFGCPVDLDHYERVADTIGAGIVVDAAAAVGTQGADGLNFGAGRRSPSVFSMHATKPFATLEGGFIYSSDVGCIDGLRAMANFGFDGARSAIMPGLNAKLNEVTAAMGLARLSEMPQILGHRAALAQAYRALLPELTFQECHAALQAHVFLPALLPRAVPGGRNAVIRRAAEAGIELGTYYAPHLGAQPYFQDVCVCDALPITDDISDRMLSLPLHEAITMRDVRYISALIREFCP
ncbi:DegT/DnrJ/EryC1/StrS family aminotransferase [Methylobacterium sp. P31]